MVPLEIKNYGSVVILKTKIRNWESKDCYCYPCKTYISNLGFSTNCNQSKDILGIYYFKLPYIGKISDLVKTKLPTFCKQFCNENLKLN